MFGRPIDKTKAKRSSTTENRQSQSASRGGKPSPQLAAKAKMAKPASAMRPKAKAENGGKPILKP